MHDFLQKPKRRHVKEIPLAPILDLLTVVIFFLILSTSFVELRQNLLPPSSTISTDVPVEQDNKVIPLNPKLLITIENQIATIHLKWGGEKAGDLIKTVSVKDGNYEFELKNQVNLIIKDFKKNFPAEKQVQVGWDANVKYQLVLSVVDGIITEIKDIVFISPEEVQKNLVNDKKENHEV